MNQYCINTRTHEGVPESCVLLQLQTFYNILYNYARFVLKMKAVVKLWGLKNERKIIASKVDTNSVKE